MKELSSCDGGEVMLDMVSVGMSRLKEKCWGLILRKGTIMKVSRFKLVVFY